ncbi:FAD-dependent oxidoreductase [Aquabacterium sp. OR-4]|uniref:FAD-dependent oxidoreductase n=1 Tax=Aquabacterium sp. OR-4 TaxID=2978127 RepID=UPI0021B41690|nr:FAD-dependent oxidoreductase [Aquabacterium sp. OR-4]MDT7838120.1 FAD-dependent oxidoreductase [Aquabacterium sp. OR-4]
MLSTYTYPRYTSPRAPELEAPGRVPRHPVVVVGAGPVGLAAAIDLAQQGQPVILLDDDDTVSVGSRGLCYAKRTLEYLDRLGVGDAVVAKGVTWNVGRTFFGDDEVFRFNLLPEADHERPGMVNLQQYYLEQYLVERAQQLPGLTLRWKHKVTAVAPGAGAGDGVRLTVATADGSFALDADWLIVADGARSPVRRMLGLDIEGKVFQDRFLIADVVMKSQPPGPGGGAADSGQPGTAPDETVRGRARPGQERWFWFDPPFHRNQSVLLHREADDVWRIDFQLGWDADPEAEKQPERVIPRIRAMLGPDAAFELEWVSVYTFQCRRMGRFRHGRVLFAGDAAHQVSPFGARGANSGLQDADNLAWKLDLVLRGLAPEALLDNYSAERVLAADENLLNSTRATDFITPKSQVSRDFRNAVLTLAREHAFARALVNSGRLSVPAHLLDSALNTPDSEPFDGLMRPGAPLADAPVQAGWLLRHCGQRFVLMLFTPSAQALTAMQCEHIARLADAPVPVHTLLVTGQAGALPAGLPAGTRQVLDAGGIARHRCDARPGTAYLLRPDQHVAARWRGLDAAAVRAAVQRATCNA